MRRLWFLLLLLAGCAAPTESVRVQFHAPAHRNLGSCETPILESSNVGLRVYINVSSIRDSLDVEPGTFIDRTYPVNRPATVRVWSMFLPYSRPSCDTTIVVK